mgnify:FL=1
MNLVKIVKSKKMNKKYDAIFKKDNGKEKTVSFGQANANDYTITKDKEARARYRKRHAKDLKTNDPSRAGYLSYHLLWGDSTNLQTNISEYKKRFKL